LGLRPVSTTIADTIEWWKSERSGTELRCGLSDEKEGALLNEIWQ
jgi:hypothetical protein